MTHQPSAQPASKALPSFKKRAKEGQPGSGTVKNPDVNVKRQSAKK